jgi:hypothetical protein
MESRQINEKKTTEYILKSTISLSSDIGRKIEKKKKINEMNKRKNETMKVLLN